MLLKLFSKIILTGKITGIQKILSSFTISKKFGFEEDNYYSDGNEGSVKFLDGSLGIVLTLLHIQNKSVKTYWREALLIFDNLTIEN